MDHRLAADLYMVEGFQGLNMLWAARCFWLPPSNFIDNIALAPLAAVSENETGWAVFCAVVGFTQLIGVVLMALRRPPRIHVTMRLLALAASSLFFFAIGCGYVAYVPDRILGMTAIFLGLRGWWSLVRIALTAGESGRLPTV